MIIVSLLLAFLLDKVFAEPKRFHPLVYFGYWAEYIERRLNQSQHSKVSGVLAVSLALIPVVVLSAIIGGMFSDYILLDSVVSAVFLYLTIGWQSLLMHVENVRKPLVANQLEKARDALAMIVSRDTATLNEHEIATATVESVLENGADAIFASIFWFCLLGVPGVVLYRLSNTLDAMWGYKDQRFLHFGWFAARLDDVMNMIPAQLTALSYALLGNTRLALQCWRQQGFSWKSPNAGSVMAAGAGALNVSLGGEARYHGQQQIRAVLGPQVTEQTLADFSSIRRACRLVNKSLLLWLLVIIIAYLLMSVYL